MRGRPRVSSFRGAGTPHADLRSRIRVYLRYPRLLIRPLVILLVVFAVLGGWRLTPWWQEVARLNALADDVPLPDDLRSDVIDRNNAAIVYAHAWQELDLVASQRKVLAANEDPDAMDAILRRNARALALTEEAVAMDRCLFRDRDGSWSLMRPDGIDKAAELMPLLEGRARLRLSRGDIGGALEDTRLQAEVLSDMLGSVHEALDYGTPACMVGSVSLLVSEMVRAQDLSAEQTGRLRESLRALDVAGSLEMALRLEQARGMLDYEDEPMGMKPTLGTIEKVKRANLYRLSQDVIDANLRPWREVRDLVEEELPDRLDDWQSFPPLLKPRFIMDSLANLNRDRDRALAWREMAVVGLDLCAWRHEQGVWPDSLDDVAPADEPNYALDPFSGEQLIYRREGDDFALYSLGPNLADDGGICCCQSEDRENYDLPFAPCPSDGE